MVEHLFYTISIATNNRTPVTFFHCINSQTRLTIRDPRLLFSDHHVNDVGIFVTHYKRFQWEDSVFNWKWREKMRCSNYLFHKRDALLLTKIKSHSGTGECLKGDACMVSKIQWEPLIHIYIIESKKLFCFLENTCKYRINKLYLLKSVKGNLSGAYPIQKTRHELQNDWRDPDR